jgi:hypothetical protein
MMKVVWRNNGDSGVIFFILIGQIIYCRVKLLAARRPDSNIKIATILQFVSS